MGKRISHRDSFELCLIRHKYFRKAKCKPTPLQMSLYDKIVKHFSFRTYYTYFDIFSIVGLDKEDVLSLGYVHLVNFWSLFRIGPKKNKDKYNKFTKRYELRYNVYPDSLALDAKNKANFTIFLKQRMEDIVRICSQKAKNIKGFKVDSSMAFYSKDKFLNNLKLPIKNNNIKYLSASKFKTIKKRAKSKDSNQFKWAGNWYISIPLAPRNLDKSDLINSGWNMHENEHNINPESVLVNKENKIQFDKQLNLFQNSSNENKLNIIANFINEKANDPNFVDEISTARLYLNASKKLNNFDKI